MKANYSLTADIFCLKENTLNKGKQPLVYPDSVSVKMYACIYLEVKYNICKQFGSSLYDVRLIVYKLQMYSVYILSFIILYELV